LAEIRIRIVEKFEMGFRGKAKSGFLMVRVYWLSGDSLAAKIPKNITGNGGVVINSGTDAGKWFVGEKN